ncbi:MAG: signal recognition particle-docking protein FtsY [Chloroflexi bacterium]|nr:signal recognition particle-docking protein FtsY [Chloroflexota bacterium]
MPWSKGKVEEGLRKSREGWFGKVVGLFRRPSLDESLWEELEELLIGADVGVATTEKLLARLKQRVTEAKLREPAAVFLVLKEEMVSILDVPRRGPSFLDSQSWPQPLVVLMAGVNGTGKTTSMAKLAHFFHTDGRKVLLGAGDTFRAAAIDQLRVWGQRLGAEVVAHQPGSDPGAVAYDALEAARSRGADVLIIDTAGRLHTKHNLMEELKKVRRVLQRLDPQVPHHTLLTLDATTGQNGLVQARYFTEAVECTGVFLAKVDGTAKGGVVLAICDQLKLPVLFLGTGEKMEDMVPFEPREFVEALFTSSQHESSSA